MEKVKYGEKLSNEAVVNKKRRKRKKELDLLRRNVLEAKRKLDNITQGFDSKGKKAGLKKMCHRLLPSRKPQFGIFANGSKGAEIKRVNLALNESDRARLEGDLQKVLNHGKRRLTESRSDALNTILHRPSSGRLDTDEQESTRILDRELERKPVHNRVAGRHCSKRKLEVSIELDEKITKKKHIEVEKVQAAKPIVAKKSHSVDRKWKRSLFTDDECDSVSIFEPAGMEELRFTPTKGESRARAEPSEPKESLDPSQRILNIKKMNFKYGQLGKMAPAKYEQLCGMVCVENFETFLQEISHIDPLSKVKRSLLDVYADTRNIKSGEDKVRLKLPLRRDSSTLGSHPVHSNIQKSKYFHDGVNVLPPQGVDSDPINPKNFLRWKETAMLPAESKLLMVKAEVKLSKNTSRVFRDPSSSGTSVIEPTTSSLHVNYDSSRQHLRSKFSKVDTEVMLSVGNLDDTLRQKFSGIPLTRKNIMWRYPNEKNNPEPLNEVGSIYPARGSAVSAENDNVQKCYFPDPLKRREMQNKKNRHAPERKLDEIWDPTLSKDGIAESTTNSADANSDNVKPCLGSGFGNFMKIDRKRLRAVVNLASASSSTLGRIPTNREEIMQRYLKEANNPEARKDNRTTLPQEGFFNVAEDDELRKRYLGDPLRRHQIKNTLFDRERKNERHVPSILRKSHASKGKKTLNTAGTALARGVLEIGNLRLKTSNFYFERVSSGSDGTVLNNFFDKTETSKKPAATSSPFPVASKRSTNPDHLNLMINVSPNMQFTKPAALLEPPINGNAFHDSTENGSNVKRNFADFGFTPDVAEGRQNTANSSNHLNLSETFNQSQTTYRQQYSSDNVDVTNFNNARQPLNLPIFHHQQRPNANSYRITYNNKNISSEDQSFRRFPILLNRKNASIAQNETRRERQQGRPLSNFAEPKVTILPNPSLPGTGDEVGCGISVPDLPYKNDGRHLQRCGAGLSLATTPQGMTIVPMRTVQLHNCINFHAPDATYQSARAHGEHQQARQCVCKNDLLNVQQVPLSVYQNNTQKVSSHKHVVPEITSDPMSFSKPTPFDVQTSQGMFQRALTTNGQISGSYGSAYSTGNVNTEIQHNCNARAQPVQFFDGQVGFVLPKNDSNPFCQTAINPPINSDQILHRQKYCPVLSKDINCNSKYFIDPRCPRAGNKWNQIDQSGAQVHQHVIQPVNNVTDAYHPQVPRSYYSTGS